MSKDIYDNKILFFRYEKNGKKKARVRKRKGEEVTEYIDDFDKVYYSEREVMNLSLESSGTSLPFRPGNKTIIENYVLSYWQYFLGFEATMTYINYLSMCISNQMPYISLEHMAENMGISVPTLNKYLEKLEQHDFVCRFWATNREHKGMNSSTRVKVRQSIPFLNESQIAELPDRLLNSHNDFMSKLLESHDISLEESTEGDSQVGEFLRKHGKRKEPSKLIVTAGPAIALEKKKDLVRDMRTEQDILIWNKMLSEISDKTSKMSFDTWFSKTFCLIREEGVFILTDHQMATEWISERYLGIIVNAWLKSTGAAADQFIIQSVEEYVI